MLLRDIVTVTALMRVSPLNFALKDFLKGITNEIDVTWQLFAAFFHEIKEINKSLK